MKNYIRKRKTNRRKIDCRRKMDYRKKMENRKLMKIKNPAFSPKELRKNQTNRMVKYPAYPQREGIPNLPLPVNISWELKALEARFFDQIDEFYPKAKIEELTQTQYSILAGGVKSNMVKLKMTEEIWNNGKSFAEFIATGDTVHTFMLLVAGNYRIHLEALRMITGKSLMDILYMGEICVHNEFDEVDNEFYKSVCSKIHDMLLADHNLDITRLTMKDLEEFHTAA